MKPLSDTLKAMPSPVALPVEQPSGCTTTGGPIALVPRSQPLTASQLTLLASRLLRKSLAITFEENTVYGRKKIADEFGEYYLEDQPVGRKTEITMAVEFHDCGQKWLESALRRSPPEAYVAHITRLALHKKLGSEVRDRAVLISDYADVLAEFPEFVVAQICEFYWKNDRRPFIPFIAEMAEACEMFMKKLYQSSKPPAPPVRRVGHLDGHGLREKLRQDDMIAHLVAVTERPRRDFETLNLYMLEMVAKSWGYGKMPDKSTTLAKELDENDLP